MYNLASYQYSLDPILALLGLSEYTPFNFSRVREPYVRKLLAKRSLMVLAITALIDAALLVLFILVPSQIMPLMSSSTVYSSTTDANFSIMAAWMASYYYAHHELVNLSTN